MLQHKDGMLSIALLLGKFPIDISLRMDLKAITKVMDDHGVTDGLNHVADQVLPGDLAAHEPVLSWAGEGVGYVAKGLNSLNDPGNSSGDSVGTTIGKGVACVILPWPLSDIFC